MIIELSDAIIKATKLTKSDIKKELALALYDNNMLTLMQASKLAEINFIDFQALLAERNIFLHYDEKDLDQDLKTLDSLFHK